MKIRDHAFARLDDIAEAYNKRHPDLTHEQAYSLCSRDDDRFVEIYGIGVDHPLSYADPYDASVSKSARASLQVLRNEIDSIFLRRNK